MAATKNRKSPKKTAKSTTSSENEFNPKVGPEHPYTLYPPPNDGKIFKQRWFVFIEPVSKMPSFNYSALLQLETLCDLYVQAALLKKFIDENGFSYDHQTSGNGRGHKTKKSYPEVLQLNKVEVLIQNYLKMLGLTMATHKGIRKPPAGPAGAGEEQEWE